MKESYLHSVRNLLDCPAREREHILTRLDSAVTAYLEDIPEADVADIITNFGTPEDCAARLLNDCATILTLAEWQKKRRRYRIIIAILTVILILAVGAAIYMEAHNWLLFTLYTHE